MSRIYKRTWPNGPIHIENEHVLPLPVEMVNGFNGGRIPVKLGGQMSKKGEVVEDGWYEIIAAEATYHRHLALCTVREVPTPPALRQPSLPSR